MPEQLKLPDIGKDLSEINDNPAGEGRIYVPSDTLIKSMDEYVQYFIGKAKSDFLSKAFESLPPSVQGFSKITYMPGQQSSEYGILQWPGLPPQTLQKLAREHVGVQLIVNVRQDEVLSYSDISEYPWKPGWKIVPKDPEEEISDSIRREIRQVELFLMSGGIGEKYNDPRERLKLERCGFPEFLTKIVRNSLTFDGMAIWTQTDGKGNVISFAPLPAQQVRLLAKPNSMDRGRGKDRAQQNFQSEIDWSGQNQQAKRNLKFKEDDFAVLVDEIGNIVKSCNRDELIWYVRNARVDVESGGYGYPECFSEDTEVLTKTGWKLFNKVNINTDLFATLNTDTREFEWQKASHQIWRDYEGSMYHINSSTLDLLVTPGHRVVYSKSLNKKSNIPNHFSINTAEEIYNFESLIFSFIPVICYIPIGLCKPLRTDK